MPNISTRLQQGASRNMVIVTIVLLVVAYGIWKTIDFRNTHEKVETTRYEPVARVVYNPFYAAELLINKQQKSDKSVEVGEIATTLVDSNFKLLMDELPDVSDIANTQDTSSDNVSRPTLIINSIGRSLTESDFLELREWVINGGHLITFSNGWADSEDMDAILDRLSELSDDGSIDDIQNDETIADLLDDIDSGNQFLAKMGIYSVNVANADRELDYEDLFDDIEDEEVAIEGEENSDNLSADGIERLLNRLANLPLLSLMVPINNNGSNTVIAVQTDHYNRQLNTEVFEAMYADSAHNLKRTNTTEIAKVSAYLNTQKQATLNQINQYKTSVQNQTDYDHDSIKKQSELLVLIDKLQKLDYDVLISLFKPIDDVYVDYTLGQGRLSVIIDSDTFTNPNPSMILPKVTKVIESGEVRETNVPFAPDITSDSLISKSLFDDPITLYSVNNAAWLSDLTQNSSQVWILPNTDVDPLPVTLWKQARLAVLGLLLLLLVWLWSLYNRFGKLKTLSQAQSYDILNYFKQVGRFGWQKDHAVKLTQDARDNARQLATELLQYAPINTGAMDNDSNVNNKANDYAHNQIHNGSVDLSSAANSNALHKILKVRLEDKRQLERAQGINGVEGFAGANYSAIADLIKPPQLRQALAPKMQDNDRVDNFTTMTQTLWVIQWLLA